MGITNISEPKLVVIPKFVMIECYNVSSPRWIKTVLLRVEEVRDYKNTFYDIFLLISKNGIYGVFVGYYVKKKKRKKRERKRKKREKE